jgi:hypothetical protein
MKEFVSLLGRYKAFVAGVFVPFHLKYRPGKPDFIPHQLPW